MSDNELRRGRNPAHTSELIVEARMDQPVATALTASGQDSQDADQVTLGEPAAAARSRSGLTELRPSGRVRHDEKITVYVSVEELIALERARLELRGDVGLSVDRGRIVRAAVAMALDDLRQNGPDGQLVHRLRLQ